MTRSDRYWFTAVGAVLLSGAAIDIWRDRCQDDTTLSCGIRRSIARVPGGRYVFAAGLATAAVGIYDHIAGPLAAAVTESL